MSESTTTVNIGDQTKVRLPLLMLLALLGATAAATIAWASVRADVATHEKSLATHESRLAELEKAQADFAVIKNDIRWLRQREERRTSAAPRE